ncbi:MAG: hypothetical protein ACP5O3_00125 [Candidatus Micrarchaeia archaeon]|jgi:hypothetical protein
MEEFVLFASAFPDFPAFEKLSGADERGLASLLSRALELVALKEFEYAPIECGKLSRLAEGVRANGLEDFFSSLKPARLEASLEAAVTVPPREVEDDERKKYECQRKAFRAIALAFYVKKVFDRVLPFDAPVFSGKHSKNEVRLASSLPEWTVVKKASLEGERKEAFVGLVGIHFTLYRKTGSLLGVNALAEEFLSRFPHRKSAARVTEMLAAARESHVDEEIERAAGAQNIKEGKRFFYSRVLEHGGFPPFVSVEVANDAYPELKIPKPRGNFGGERK